MLYPFAEQRTAYVGLGSNVGDRAAHLLLGLRGMLDACLKVHRLSPIYETQPVGYDDQPPFLNMVAELRGDLPVPEQLLARLLRIEYAVGRRRNREIKDGPRKLDLDLLLYDGETRHSDYITIPHPRLHLRRFVLVPLAEIAPDFKHPTLQESISHLLLTTTDRSEVKRWPANDAR